MNLNNLSVEEIINYCHNRVIESVDASTLLRIVSEMESAIEDVKQEGYDDGYEVGFDNGRSEGYLV